MGAVAHAFENSIPNNNLTGSLRDVWEDGGYFWKGLFTKGADNRLLLTHVIDRLTRISLQMAERRTAINELTGYYAYITGDDFPQEQRQRLNAWVSAGYDARDYPVYSEMGLKLQRDRERPLDSIGDVPTISGPWEVNGRRKGSMIPAKEVPYE